jgi:hypothetical protein
MQAGYRFLLADVEREAIHLNPEVQLFLTNVRLMVSVYRRHMVIGIISNILYSSIVIAMMYTAGHQRLMELSGLLTLFLYVALTFNFLAAVCKVLIMVCGKNITDPRLAYRVLRENVWRFLASRVYYWARLLGKYLFYVNFCQFILSFMYLVLGNFNLPVLAGIFMSALFLVRIGTNIYELQEIAQRDTDPTVLSELLEQFELLQKGQKLGETVECTVCLEEITKESNPLFLLCPFNHVFHKACIVEWMKKKLSCPICRSYV